MNNYFRGGCTVAVFFGLASAAFAQGVTGNAFNPAISAILDGKYAHYSSDPADYAISGFALGDEVGLAPAGFSLGESELTASANVDDQFFGQLTVALAAKDDATEVEVEEAFVQTTALPAGFTLKGGRFFSDVGYLNSKHAHAWDFVDQPLVYTALLGNQYGDDGVQVRYVAPTTWLVELGGEAFRGAHFPSAGATHGGIGVWTAFAHAGTDVGISNSWRAGVSYLHTDAEGRESATHDGDLIAFTGSSGLWIADFVWKWSERGNPKSRNLVVQAEYMHRSEDGVVTTDASPPGYVADETYRGVQQGFYAQATYQFMPRWRTGVRFDRLNADNEGPDLGIETPLGDAHRPSRVTAMLDFSNSEFSRIRLQAASDKSRPQSDTQFALQYVMSIGAHGAHQF